MKSTKALVIAAVSVLLLMVIGYEVTKWTVMRVYVGKDEALVVINKFGDPLPPDMVVVPVGENHYKGIEEEMRGPGRYFIDPFWYDYKIVPQIEIPAGDPTQWAWDDHSQLKDPSTAP